MNKVKADFCMSVAIISAVIGLLILTISVVAFGVCMLIATIFLGIAIQLTIKDKD